MTMTADSLPSPIRGGLAYAAGQSIAPLWPDNRTPEERVHDAQKAWQSIQNLPFNFDDQMPQILKLADRLRQQESAQA
jgi:hypothetical protein